MDKEINTEEIIATQESEMKIVELNSILAEKENEIIRMKEENEKLRLHNQSLYTRQVVANVTEDVKEKPIEHEQLRGLWK